MNKLLAVVQVLTLAGLAFLVSRTWNVNDDLVQLEHRLKQHAEVVGGQLAQHAEAVSAQLQQQSTAINRALGTQIPLRLPPDVEAEIRAIEDILGAESKWPKVAGEVQQLNDRLGKVVDSLSPWAQEQVLPRLLPRRWEVDALWLLANATPTELDALLDYQLSVDGHLESKPGNASEAVHRRLESRRDEVTRAVREATILHAERALEEGNTDEGARLVGSLSEEDGKALQAKLKIAVAERDLRDALKNARTLLEQTANITDLTLKGRAVARARDAIVDVRIRLLAEPGLATSLEPMLADLQDKVDRQVDEVEKAQSAEAATAQRNYQVWALGEIKKVRKLEEIETELLQKISSVFDRNNPLSDAAKGAKQKAMVELRDAMVRHLAPINQAALDVAVGQWFQKVYQQRFDSLDEKSQLEVVTEFAIAVKKAIE